MSTKKAPTRPSMRAAINAKCKECIYDPYGNAGFWRQQVEACTSYACPLYPLRPMSIPAKKKESSGRWATSVEQRGNR